MLPKFKTPFDEKEDYWTYQVFLHKKAFGESGTFYAIHEVNYYKGKLQHITSRPVNNAYYDSVDELSKDLYKMINDIGVLPIINYEERDDFFGKGTTH